MRQARKQKTALRLSDSAVTEATMTHQHGTAPTVLGIDPGLDGGVALILPGGAEAHVTPTLAAGQGGKRLFDTTGMLNLLRAHPIDLAVIEAVGPMPKQGVTSTFRFGEGYGLWLGMLAALGIPVQTVKPQAWKKVILAGTPKDKAAAVQYVQRRYPAVSLLPTPRLPRAARRPGRRSRPS